MRERNYVILYAESHMLLGDINQSANLKVYQAVKKHLDPVAVRKRFQDKDWYFMVRRESYTGKSSGKPGADATGASAISSVGLLYALDPDVKTAADRMHVLHGGLELRAFYDSAGRWTRKKALSILTIYYKDSPVSGIIAHRAIEQNHFLDAKLAEDAQARMARKDPANPSLCAGSWEDYNDIDYERTSDEAIGKNIKAQRAYESPTHFNL